MKKIIIYFLAVAVLAASGWKLFFAKTESEEAVIIGINPWVGYEFLYLAEQKGFLAQEGLNIVLQQYGSLGDVRAAFERGHVDGITSTPVELIQANAVGSRRLKSVLVADFSDGADVIVANSPIKNISELKGKKVAVERASLGMFVLARALDKNNLSLNDIEPLVYDQANIRSALQEGKVDAAVTYPPFSIDILKDGGVNKIFDSSMISGEVSDIISLDERILKKNPNLVPSLLRAWEKSLAYARVNPKESYEIMARRENISPEDFEAALDGIHIVSVAEQGELMKIGGKLEQSIEFMSKVLKQSGELDAVVEKPGDYIFRAK